MHKQKKHTHTCLISYIYLKYIENFKKEFKYIIKILKLNSLIYIKYKSHTFSIFKYKLKYHKF